MVGARRGSCQLYARLVDDDKKRVVRGSRWRIEAGLLSNKPRL